MFFCKILAFLGRSDDCIKRPSIEPWTAFTVHQIRVEEDRLLDYLAFYFDALERQTETLSLT